MILQIGRFQQETHMSNIPDQLKDDAALPVNKGPAAGIIAIIC